LAVKVLSSSIFGKNRDGKAVRLICAKKAVGQAADMLKRMNLVAFVLLLRSAKELAEIVFYAYAFPGIRKKYSLNGIYPKKQ